MTITGSAAELLARASSRERVTPADARSGAVFERIMVGSDCYFVKHLGFASDWVMRVTGDDVCRQYLIWQAGSWTGSRAASIPRWWPWTWPGRATTLCWPS